MFLQSEKVTLAQDAFISSVDKIKIFILNLYYKDRDKLETYLVQINLYVKQHELQF